MVMTRAATKARAKQQRIVVTRHLDAAFVRNAVALTLIAAWLAGTRLLVASGWIAALLKAAPCAWLALATAWRGEFLLASALALSAFGDAALELEGTFGPPGFLAGLGLFFAGHVAFVARFIRAGALSRGGPIAAPAMLLAYTAFLIATLWSRLEAPLRVPVAAYALVLWVMGASATRLPPAPIEPPSPADAKKQARMLKRVAACKEDCRWSADTARLITQCRDMLKDAATDPFNKENTHVDEGITAHEVDDTLAPVIAEQEDLLKDQDKKQEELKAKLDKAEAELHALEVGWLRASDRNAGALVRAMRSPQGRACFGALLFIASDSVLAWDRFVAPLPCRAALVMGTYFGAQLLLASVDLAPPRNQDPFHYARRLASWFRVGRTDERGGGGLGPGFPKVIISRESRPGSRAHAD